MSEQQLPAGIEWPRFEDGALVHHHDQIMHDGRAETVQAIYFYKPGHVILSLVGVDYEILHHLFDGETVERPPVLDKDGQEIEVGDTVYGGDGKEWHVTGFDWGGAYAVAAYHGDTVRQLKPEWLTHERPDSWERLREDVEQWNKSGSYCRYYGATPCTCEGCPKIDDKCGTDIAALDILVRAERLAGVMGSD